MSTIGKEYRLAIRIAGVVDKSLTTSLAAANTSLKSSIAAINTNFTKLDKGFSAVMLAGKKCFSAITTAAGVATIAIAAATAGVISAGTKFESAFAGVKKTVEATEEEYEQLKKDILDMATVLPASQTEIAGVMEIAGQLGIAMDSLTDFTETMINLGVSTNLSAEDAATALAKFANIMSMENYGADGISNYERLGSVIVELGNNFATTESDIVSMATNLAAAGNLANMSEADIMAISAAMSSVGLAAESGGSSMSRLLMEMQQAVADGGDELKGYAKTAGMTSKEFATLFREDAGEALVLFIEGLNTAGEDSYDILEDLGLSTIRTRKAFLSLAGADDLLREALSMANAEWEENNALAIEANKRYETTESQIQLMKNAFSDFGIAAYEYLRKPFIDVVNSIAGKMTELKEKVSGPDGISKWLKNIGTELPTLQRKIKKYGEGILNFFEPLINIGKWFLKNPKVIVSALVGIGSAMVTYKIASNLVHIVNALMSFASMNPVTIGIMGVVTAVGFLAGGLAAYKQYEQELIDSNLEAHFGNIALSIEELQEVAEYIVSSESLGGVKEALEAFEDLDTISSTMENAISEIDKMNWKVSIGMELTEDDQESYKTTIEEYVSAAQEYALQSQYAVSLNIAIAFDDESITGNYTSSKVNKFYADMYNEMTELGTKLNEAVTDAFNDGLLDIKESQVIAEIQAEMAAIEEALATGEFDAQLSILGMEYAGGGSLTPDSFQNLQAELAKQVDDATAAYKEAYAKNYAAIQATYESGGYLTDKEYEKALAALQEEYLRNISEVQMKSINFQLETIMKQYEDELDPAIQEYIEGIQGTLGSYTENGIGDWVDRQGILWNGLIEEVLANKTLDKTTRGAIAQLLEELQPTMEDVESLLQQYRDMGVDIPASIIEGISTYNMLGAISGDGIAAAAVLGEQIVDGEHYSSFYQEMLEAMREVGGYIPEEIAVGISLATAQVAAEEIDKAAATTIRPVVEGMYAWTQETIDEYYANGFTAEAGVNILLNPSFNRLSALNGLNINQRANGGLATRPELTWFAENGPEMAIPIDGSQNAISLWEQTGRLLGMDSALDGLDLNSGSGSPKIEYNPTLQFYGEAPSRNDLEDALKVSQDEFESLMERYFKTHGRVSFG